MTTRRQTLGQWGEQLAESHLVKAGAEVVLRNYRSDHGEIDLVVKHDGDLVGVEVKTRTLLDVEQPEEAVTRRQLIRIANALVDLAIDMGYEDLHWRIDVVAVAVHVNGTVERLEHIRDAYPA
jgi:putative endonuclease